MARPRGAVGVIEHGTPTPSFSVLTSRPRPPKVPPRQSPGAAEVSRAFHSTPCAAAGHRKAWLVAAGVV